MNPASSQCRLNRTKISERENYVLEERVPLLASSLSIDERPRSQPQIQTLLAQRLATHRLFRNLVYDRAFRRCRSKAGIGCGGVFATIASEGKHSWSQCPSMRRCPWSSAQVPARSCRGQLILPKCEVIFGLESYQGQRTMASSYGIEPVSRLPRSSVASR